MQDQCSQTTEPEENWNFIKNGRDKEREKLSFLIWYLSYITSTVLKIWPEAKVQVHNHIRESVIA